MITEPNPYAPLGLLPSSSYADVKRRYRQLAKQYHPDRNGDTADSEEKLRVLNASYALLSDPARKAAYDRRVVARLAPAKPAFAPRPVPYPLRQTRRKPRRTAAGFGLALLVSTGVGVFLMSSHDLPALNVPALTKLLPQVSGQTVAGSDTSGADFSFIPSRSAFGDQNTSGAPSPKTAKH